MIDNKTLENIDQVSNEAYQDLLHNYLKAKMVLKFYAEKTNWQSPSEGFALQYDPEPSPIKKDKGKMARELLKELE